MRNKTRLSRVQNFVLTIGVFCPVSKCTLGWSSHILVVLYVVCLFVCFLTQKISATNPSTIKASNFQTHRKTRFLIHGYLVGMDLLWISNMCRVWYDYCLTVVLLVCENANIHITPLTGLKMPHKIYCLCSLVYSENI